MGLKVGVAVRCGDIIDPEADIVFCSGLAFFTKFASDGAFLQKNFRLIIDEFDSLLFERHTDFLTRTRSLAKFDPVFAFTGSELLPHHK